MTAIVDLRPARGGDPMVEVVLESGDRVRLHSRRLLEHAVAIGDSITAGELAALRRAAAADAAERRALRLIGRRPRSRAELGRRWGLAPAEAAAVIDRLAGMGACDDGGLGEAVVGSRRARGHGGLRIEAALARLGMADDARAEVAAATASGEEARARTALARRFGPAGVPPDPASLRRAAGFLARRGFDADTVACVLETLDPDP